MADSKKSRGRQDRGRVSASEPYEVNYFARKNKISAAMTKRLIKKFRGNRKKMEAALKGGGRKKKKKAVRRKKRR
jgi:hypothetical protein